MEFRGVDFLSVAWGAVSDGAQHAHDDVGAAIVRERRQHRETDCAQTLVGQRPRHTRLHRRHRVVYKIRLADDGGVAATVISYPGADHLPVAWGAVSDRAQHAHDDV